MLLCNHSGKEKVDRIHKDQSRRNKAPSDDELLIDNLTVFCVGVLFYIVRVNPLHTFDCTLSTLTGLRNIISLISFGIPGTLLYWDSLYRACTILEL